MSLCFVDPADAIRAIADSVGREARRQLLGEAVRAWVDEIPDDELEAHYAKAISELDEHDISMLAAWHGSMDVGHPIPNRDFLMGAFPARSATTAARRSSSPPASAARRPSTRASPRSARSRRCSSGSRRRG